MIIVFAVLCCLVVLLWLLFKMTTWNDYSGDGGIAGALIFGLPAVLIAMGAVLLGAVLLLNLLVVVPLWIQIAVIPTPAVAFYLWMRYNGE